MLTDRIKNPRGVPNDDYYVKFNGVIFTKADHPNCPEQTGVDCGIMCLLIMEKRLNGHNVWDISTKCQDEYTFEICGQYRARIVSHFLMRGDRHNLTRAQIQAEEDEAKKDEESLKRTKAKTAKNLGPV